jgi:hypothetical protein
MDWNWTNRLVQRLGCLVDGDSSSRSDPGNKCTQSNTARGAK